MRLGGGGSTSFCLKSFVRQLVIISLALYNTTQRVAADKESKANSRHAQSKHKDYNLIINREQSIKI